MCSINNVFAELFVENRKIKNSEDFMDILIIDPIKLIFQ